MSRYDDWFAEARRKDREDNVHSFRAPFRLRPVFIGDISAIPPRQWLLGNWFCRRFVSSLVGDGAAGKTALRMACALALATGRSDILDLHVFERVPVAYLSFEDDNEELSRRFGAAMKHHRVTDDDVEGYLFAQSVGDPALKFARQTQSGNIEIGPLGQALESAIESNNLGCLFLDPFVKTHSLDENSNQQMDALIGLVADIAGRCNVAIDLPHHTSKGMVTAGDANRGRGASAVKDGGRLVYTLTDMTDKEAKEEFGIPASDRLDLMRVDSGKVNLAKRNAKTQWFRRVGVKLGNTEVNPLYPEGDTVQTVEPWSPPDAFHGLTYEMLVKIFAVLRSDPEPGEKWRVDRRANQRWAGWPVATIANKSKGEAQIIVKNWIHSGLLNQEVFESPSRKAKIECVTLDPTIAANILSSWTGP